MKRNIKDLKPNEAIEISKIKEFKKIFGRAYCIAERLPFFIIKQNNELRQVQQPPSYIQIIHKASDFKKPNKLKKRVKELEDMVTQLDGRVKQLENLWAKDAYKVIRVDNEPTQEPEIDWSKAGTLVCNSFGTVWEVVYDNFDHTFQGIARIKHGHTIFEYRDMVIKDNLKLYKGQITLSNQ